MFQSKKIINITIIFIVIIVAGLISFYIYLFYFFNFGDCKNTALQKIYNPPKNMYIILFHRDCTATTTISSQLTLFNNNVPLTNDTVGNIFITNDQKCVRNIIWKDDKNIFLEHSCNPEKIFKQEIYFNNIFIEYKKID